MSSAIEFTGTDWDIEISVEVGATVSVGVPHATIVIVDNKSTIQSLYLENELNDVFIL